jgi:MYXO-CTERM domain-containing protein
MLTHASRSSRHVFLMAASVALLVGGLSRTAAAKTCTTDTDCSTGQQCVMQATAPTGGATSVGSSGATSVGSGGTPGTIAVGTGGAGGSPASAGGAVGSSCPKGSNCVQSGSTPPVLPPNGGAQSVPNSGPLPPAPEPMPVTGICEPKPIVCITVADCPSTDFDCLVEPISPPACPADSNCATPSLPSTTGGTCVAKAHACSTATDCPAPLTCQALAGTCTGSAAVGPDGKIISTSESCTPGPSVCSWNPVTCAVDSDCADPLYECVKTGDSGSCSSSGGGACAAGETCPPVPQQPTCVTTPVMYCLPTLVDCACGPCPAGSTCGPCQTCLPGWSCFDFSNVGGVPPAWGSIASNKACLPDGIALFAQGHTALNGQLVSGSSSSSSSSSGGTPTLDVGGAGGASGGTGGASGNDGRSTGGAAQNPPTVSPAPTAEGTAGASGSAQPMAHSSGCAYSGSEASSPWLALAMIGLVARLARRRREDR